ncbi:hypothetical protein [Burkholderia guangdongensis]|uniref:hypothetical protein n=1 Tax=Burkholderia guangdongensis TaxID=1792500 RepID=UPI001C543548|nr:hypothetical protein [Burkholderia guangdongensis]
MNDIIEAVSLQRQEPMILARKSWVAYAGRVLIAVWMLVVIPRALWGKSPVAAIIVALVVIGGIVYTIALERSYVLYMDDSGVWLARGILPWSKGVTGVKWRDLDGALYITGFVSWATNSYTVHLAHRFTKSSEIHISHMHAGNQAVEAINGAHAEMIRRAG